MPAPRPTNTHWRIFGPLSGAPRDFYSEEEVIAILREPGEPRSVCFQLCSFPKALNLSSFKCSAALVFRDCEFMDEVNLTDARFEKSLSFEDCVFARGLVLRGAHIKGLLCLEGSIIGPPKTFFDEENIERPLHEPPPSIRSAHWDCICVEGPFNLVRTSIFGSVDLGHAEIHGSLFMQGARIGLGEFGGRLYLRQSRIDGDLELSPWVWERKPWRLTWKRPPECNEIGEANDIWSAKLIEWSDRFYNYHPEIATDDSKKLREQLLNQELEAAISLLWRDSQLPMSPAPARRTEIFGSLSFGASEIQGRVNIRGAHIYEALHGITAHVHNRILADCWIHPDLMREDMPGLTAGKDWFRTTIGRIDQPAIECSSQIEERIPALNREMRGIILEDAVIDHGVLMQGLQCIGELRINNIRIGGTLELGVWKAKHKSGTKPYCPTTLEFPLGGFMDDWALIEMKNAQISASVIFDGAQIDGDIDANHCIVGANFTMRASMESDWDLGKRQVPTVAKTKSARRKSAAASDAGWDCIDLYGARIAGNLDFSGARIYGGLKLSYLRLGGTLMLGHDLRAGAPRPLSAKIGFGKEGDSIRLYGAEVGGNVCIERAILKGSLMMKLAQVGGALICAPLEPKRRDDKYVARVVIGLGQRPQTHGVTATGTNSPENRPALSLETAKIGGGIRFEACTFVGSIKATNVRVQGSLDMEPHRFRYPKPMDSGETALESKRQSADRYNVRVNGSLNLQGATIEGGLHLRALILACPTERPMDIDAREAKIALDGRFGGISLTGSVILTDSQFGGEVSFGDPTAPNKETTDFLDELPSKIGSRVSLRRARIAGTLTFFRAVIGAACEPVVGKAFGTLHRELKAWHAKNPDKKIERHLKILAINRRNAYRTAKEARAVTTSGYDKTVSGFGREKLLHMTEIEWKYPIGVMEPERDAASDRGAAVLDMHQTQIGGAFRTTFQTASPEGRKSECNQFENSAPSKFLVRVNGRTDLAGVEIGGKCLLVSVLFCGDVTVEHCRMKSDFDLSWSAILGSLNVESGTILGRAFSRHRSDVTWWVLGALNLKNARFCELALTLNPRLYVERDHVNKPLETDYRFRLKKHQFLAPAKVDLENMHAQILFIGGALDPRIAPSFNLSGFTFEDLDLAIYENFPASEGPIEKSIRTIRELPLGFLTFDTYFDYWRAFPRYDAHSLSRLKILISLKGENSYIAGQLRRGLAAKAIYTLTFLSFSSILLVICWIVLNPIEASGGADPYDLGDTPLLIKISGWILSGSTSATLLLIILFREAFNVRIRREWAILQRCWEHNRKLFGVIAFIAFVFAGILMDSSQMLLYLAVVAVMFVIGFIIMRCRLVNAETARVSKNLTLKKLTAFSKRSERPVPHAPEKLWGHDSVYNLLLAQTANYDETAYDYVERHLRQMGKDADAHTVYLERCYRELTHGTMQWLAFMLRMLLNFAVGSGVRPLRILCVLFGWFVVSSIIYSNPESVEHPPTYVVSKRKGDIGNTNERFGAGLVPERTTHEPDHEWNESNKGKPPSLRWNWTDGVWVALNVHVPVLHFWARDEWEPSSRRIIVHCSGGKDPNSQEMTGRVYRALLSYETYASIVQIFTYLAIPFLLTGWANVSRRQQRTG